MLFRFRKINFFSGISAETLISDCRFLWQFRHLELNLDFSKGSGDHLEVEASNITHDRVRRRNSTCFDAMKIIMDLIALIQGR